MTSGVELHAASIDDLPRIVELKLATFAESARAALLPPGSMHAILSDYQRLYGKGLATHFVARSSGAIIACVGSFLKTDLPFRYFNPPRYGFIGDVYTVPEYRGRGLSRRLNEEALRWLQGQGVSMVRLLASEAGRGLYERLGFKPSDEMVLSLPTDNAL